jgi:hypothetical protein
VLRNGGASASRAVLVSLTSSVTVTWFEDELLQVGDLTPVQETRLLNIRSFPHTTQNPPQYCLQSRIRTGQRIENRELPSGALFHVGLNVDRFTLDVNNPSTARAVEADVKLAGELGVYAVPTLIIDRKWVVEGALQRFTLEMVFEQLVETGSVLTPVHGVRRLRPAVPRIA